MSISKSISSCENPDLIPLSIISSHLIVFIYQSRRAWLQFYCRSVAFFNYIFLNAKSLNIQSFAGASSLNITRLPIPMPMKLLD